MNKLNENLSPEDKAGFVRALVERLAPRSEPGFSVRVAKKNTFDLAAVRRGGESRVISIMNEKSSSRYGSYHKPIPVKEISDETRRMYPRFLLPPGFIAVSGLEADYGVPEEFSLAAIFDAIARRINAKGAVLEIYDFVPNRGWTTLSSVRCGRSLAEAVLRMSV